MFDRLCPLPKFVSFAILFIVYVFFSEITYEAPKNKHR